MRTEGPAGEEPQGLVAALRGLDFILGLMGSLYGVFKQVVI